MHTFLIILNFPLVFRIFKRKQIFDEGPKVVFRLIPHLLEFLGKLAIQLAKLDDEEDDLVFP